jgi:hypothetical protein
MKPLCLLLASIEGVEGPNSITDICIIQPSRNFPFRWGKPDVLVEQGVFTKKTVGVGVE